MKLTKWILGGALLSLALSVTSLFAEVPVVDVRQDSARIDATMGNSQVLPQNQTDPSDTTGSMASDEQNLDNSEENLTQEGLSDNQAPVASQSTLLLSKIEALQKEIQTLRGTLEVQQHDLKLLQKQQQAYYKDLDNRLVKIKKQSGSISSLPKQSNPATSSKMHQLKQSRAILPKGSDKLQYQYAYKLIKNKSFSKAIDAMKAFVEGNPKSHLVSNAYYWLGELYLIEGRGAKSVKAFQKVINDYPNSSKVPGAMLKLGFAYSAEGRLTKAKAQLARVTKSYPNSALARLAEVRIQKINDNSFN